MLESPFDPQIGFACLDFAGANNFRMQDDEASILSNKASPKRKDEFRLGRAAAHLALERLGHNVPTAILQGSGREPIWPKGIVGSITHSKNNAIAAVAPSSTYLGVGIDLEVINRNFSSKLKYRICHPDEIEWIDAETEGRKQRTIMIFSAKEAIYKACYPSCQRYISFKEAFLKWLPEKSAFEAQLLFAVDGKYPKNTTIEVGCIQQGDFVFTFLNLEK